MLGEPQNKKSRGFLPSLDFFNFMVRPAGFEPAAYGFEVRRSIQLSYGRKFIPFKMPLFVHLLRQAQIFVLKILNVCLRLKSSLSLNLNKI